MKRSLFFEMDTSFSRILLKDSRKDAAKNKVKIPHLLIYKTSFRDYWEVRSLGNIVWEGTASDAYEARSKAIDLLIEKALESKGNKE